MRSIKPKNKSIVIASIVGFSILALGITIYIPRIFRGATAPITVAEVTTTGVIDLAFNPSSISTNPGNTVDIPMVITVSSLNKATGVSVELAYDPNSLSIQAVTPGDFFNSILDAGSFGAGKITFTYVVPPSSGGKSGSGTVVTIKAKLLKSGSTTINFGNSTIATAIGVTSNALKSVAGVSIKGQGRSDIYPQGGDGTVNLLDYNQLTADFGKTGVPGFIASDINTSGKVDLLDYNLLATDFGKNY